MEIHKLKTFEECMATLHNYESTCEKRFTKIACVNMKNYFVDFCHRRFDKTSTFSSESTPGETTLNLTYKSPSDPR